MYMGTMGPVFRHWQDKGKEKDFKAVCVDKKRIRTKMASLSIIQLAEIIGNLWLIHLIYMMQIVRNL